MAAVRSHPKHTDEQSGSGLDGVDNGSDEMDMLWPRGYV